MFWEEDVRNGQLNYVSPFFKIGIVCTLPATALLKEVWTFW